MSIDTPTLLDALDSVTAIPIIPFKDGEIDYAGHAKNINYLMQNNYLEGDSEARDRNRWNEPRPSRQLGGPNPRNGCHRS